LLPNYLAPEQILGQNFDTRSDLFSLAVVVYEMLAGRYPFEAPSGVIPREIVHSDPKPLRELNALIPEELEQTLVRALKKDPKERLETANELAASLYASALALRRHQPPVDGSAGGSDAGQSETAAPAPSAAPQPSPSELLALASATGTLAPVDIAETAPAPAGITAPAPIPQPATPEHAAQSEPVAVALTTSSETAPELQSAFAFPPSAETSAAPSAQAVAPQPPQVIPEPPAAPAAQTPQPAPPGQWPSPVGSVPAVQPAPRKTNKSISLGRRIFVVAVAAALAIWAMATIISRQNLNASQDKPAEPAVQAPSAPAPAAPPSAPELPPAQVQSTPSPEPAPAPKKVENPAPRPEQILRVQVKALWEAGRYSEAMRLVDGVLQENPGNAEAQGWKTRIRSAQDAEAAMK
jgi:serine/threonine-protein kinase